jgi:hypothetical protein
MGGERSSSTRMRLSGKICCNCKSSLPPPHTLGEKYCARCTAQKSPRKRIYMHFVLTGGWYCQFLEEDLKTPLPKTLSFQDRAKIYAMAARGGSLKNLEARQALDHAIENGRGGIFLELTEEQYQKLKNGRR